MQKSVTVRDILEAKFSGNYARMSQLSLQKNNWPDRTPWLLVSFHTISDPVFRSERGSEFLHLLKSRNVQPELIHGIVVREGSPEEVMVYLLGPDKRSFWPKPQDFGQDVLVLRRMSPTGNVERLVSGSWQEQGRVTPQRLERWLGEGTGGTTFFFEYHPHGYLEGLAWQAVINEHSTPKKKEE